MKRRDVLEKASIGITATVGATGLAAARSAERLENVEAQAPCGICETQVCWCSGDWYDCGGSECCTGDLYCDCLDDCSCPGHCK